MKKKGFTLIEILLVVLIIWVMLSAGSKFFRPASKNKFYAQTCVNKVYWEVRTFTNNAIFGKWIAYSGAFYFPKTYNIVFDKINNKINLEIEIQTWTITTSTIYLSWSRMISECWNEWYQVFFSWDVDEVKIRKNLEEKWSVRWFTIIPQQFTWNIDFYMEEHGIPRKSSVFIIDQRIQSISNKRCFSLPADIHKECSQRSE